MPKLAALIVALLVIGVCPAPHARAQGEAGTLQRAADATVAFNAKLQALMEGYFNAVENDDLVVATLELVSPDSDRERAIGVAQRELVRLSERIEALDAAFAALGEPPANYLPGARASLPHVLAYLEFLRSGADQLQTNLRAQIGAVMRGDLQAARAMVREDIDQIIMELGAENTMLRFQEGTLRRASPYRGVLRAIIAGNEVARAYLTILNGVDADEATLQRQMGKLSLWLFRQRREVDQNEKTIATFCRASTRMEDAMREAFVAFCSALKRSNTIERSIGEVMDLQQEIAADVTKGESVLGDPRLAEVDTKLGERVANRLENQTRIRERGAALARFVGR